MSPTVARLGQRWRFGLIALLLAACAAPVPPTVRETVTRAPSLPSAPSGAIVRPSSQRPVVVGGPLLSGPVVEEIPVPQPTASHQPMGSPDARTTLSGAAFASSSVVAYRDGFPYIHKSPSPFPSPLGLPETAFLTEAPVRVLDGARHVSEGGRPLEAWTDSTGRFAWRAPLPKTNLVVVVGMADMGNMLAFLPAGGETVDVDIVSTLVVEAIWDMASKDAVKQQLITHLTPVEAERTRTEILAAADRVRGNAQVDFGKLTGTLTRAGGHPGRTDDAPDEAFLNNSMDNASTFVAALAANDRALQTWLDALVETLLPRLSAPVAPSP